MDSKPWYQSKVLIINVLAGGAAVASAFGVDLGLDDATKAEIAGGLLAVINIVLRAFFTKTAIGS